MTPAKSCKALSAVSLLWLAAGIGLGSTAACALSVELKDVAPDRIERQRQSADGRLPLPGAPELSRLSERLAESGLKFGSPMLIRIFKAQSELEIWMEKGDSYVLFATYPICHWSGTLGPKQLEGDKQTPEGFYTISSRQLHRMGRWQHALNLGFPNVYDEAHARNGSYILVHGGCSSVGCFAMTNPGIAEIYQLTSAALKSGQRFIPVHVFPFRMTEDNLAKNAASEWLPFWRNLKEGSDSFERTRRPPRISVCDNKYLVQDATSPLEAGDPGPLAACGPTAALIHTLEQSGIFAPQPALSRLSKTSKLRPMLQSLLVRASLQLADPSPGSPAAVVGRESGTSTRAISMASEEPSYSCAIQRASCRKFVALQAKMAKRRLNVASATGRKVLTSASKSR